MNHPLEATRGKQQSETRLWRRKEDKVARSSNASNCRAISFTEEELEKVHAKIEVRMERKNRRKSDEWHESGGVLKGKEGIKYLFHEKKIDWLKKKIISKLFSKIPAQTTHGHILAIGYMLIRRRKQLERKFVEHLAEHGGRSNRYSDDPAMMPRISMRQGSKGTYNINVPSSAEKYDGHGVMGGMGGSPRLEHLDGSNTKQIEKLAYNLYKAKQLDPVVLIEAARKNTKMGGRKEKPKGGEQAQRKTFIEEPRSSIEVVGVQTQNEDEEAEEEVQDTVEYASPLSKHEASKIQVKDVRERSGGETRRSDCKNEMLTLPMQKSRSASRISSMIHIPHPSKSLLDRNEPSRFIPIENKEQQSPKSIQSVTIKTSDFKLSMVKKHHLSKEYKTHRANDATDHTTPSPARKSSLRDHPQLFSSRKNTVGSISDHKDTNPYLFKMKFKGLPLTSTPTSKSLSKRLPNFIVRNNKLSSTTETSS